MDKSKYAGNGPWWTRDDHVYFDEGKLSPVDISSFQPLGTTWARDAKRVYSHGLVIRGADPATFIAINSLYGKDDHHIYTLTGKMKEIEASTFVGIGPTAHWFNTENGYGKDSQFVYHTTVGGKACALKKADTLSFTSLGNGFGCDQAAVYFETKQLSGADPAEWNHIRGPHSRSGNKGYCLNKRIRGADGHRLESLPILESPDYWSRDEKGFFRWDEPRDSREYLDVFRDCFIFVGKVSNVELTYRRVHQIPADAPASWEFASHAWIWVVCKQWLQQPDVAVAEAPVIGELFRFGEGLHLNLLAPPTWMNEDRIWIFMPTQNYSRVEPSLRLSSVPLWSEYLALSQLEFIKGLIREANSV